MLKKIILTTILLFTATFTVYGQAPGTMTWFDGSIYEGQIEDDNRHGNGTMTWSDGRKYTGQWQNDERHGTGTMTWPNGRKHEGEWQNDKYGDGVMTWPDGSRYTGQWQNDRRHGTGTMTWPDGSKYEGQWRNDKMHGRGIMTYSDGKRNEGQWERGQSIIAKKNLYIMPKAAMGMWFGREKLEDISGNVGLGIDYFFNNYMALITELTFKFDKYETIINDDNIYYITVPVGFRYYINKNIFLGGGLYYSYNINYDSAFNNYGLFADIGTSFNFSSGMLNLYARCNYGKFKEDGYSTKWQPVDLTLNIAYGFGF